MPRRPKFSTSTLTEDGRIVPWLAATGPLAYSPENPPDRDYFFQYTWILPDIFDPKVNRRQHYSFGVPHREYADEPFSFWEAARNKVLTPVITRYGSISETTVTAPIAVYAYERRVFGPTYMLMQHGSYQQINFEEQPLLDEGDVVLYRGVQEAATFRYFQLSVSDLGGQDLNSWCRYVKTQARVLSDSVLSFNSIHERAKRCETGDINDRSWMSDDLARGNELDIDNDGFAKQLWDTTTQSFSLVQNLGKWKFGPNYIICKTPIDNIRLTTFFAGEYEARVIDPSKVEFVEAVGCKVEQIR